MATPDPSDPLRRYLRVQGAAEREVNRILQEALRDLEPDLKRLESRSNIGAVVRRTQLQAVRFSLLRRIAEIFRRLGLLIRERSVDAALAAARAAARWDEDFLNRLGLSLSQKRAWQTRLQESARRSAQLGVNRRFDTSWSTNRELSERVYGSQNLANRLVQNKIESGLARGLSAAEMAREIRGLIRPDVPGGVSYAAKRLARTELNNAFHYQQIQDAMQKPWVKAMRWRISGSHPEEDICDKIAADHSAGRAAGEYLLTEVPDKPHPQCLCSLVPVTMSQEDFLESLLAGDIPQQNLPG